MSGREAEGERSGRAPGLRAPRERSPPIPDSGEPSNIQHYASPVCCPDTPRSPPRPVAARPARVASVRSIYTLSYNYTTILVICSNAYSHSLAQTCALLTPSPTFPVCSNLLKSQSYGLTALFPPLSTPFLPFHIFPRTTRSNQPSGLEVMVETLCSPLSPFVHVIPLAAEPHAGG